MFDRPPPPPPKYRADPELIERVLTFIAFYGDQGAADRLNVSVPTLARIVGGLSVRRGTLAVVRMTLAERDRAAERGEIDASSRDTRAAAAAGRGRSSGAPSVARAARPTHETTRESRSAARGGR